MVKIFSRAVFHGHLVDSATEHEFLDEQFRKVVAADRDYRLLAKNPLGDAIHATPAVAGGRIYVRTFHHLIAIGKPRR